ncbi:MAG: PAS domain S-box protein [Planctomycetes bacterium]|nr:PAS domain S-box protein [Planctomycetota bacterium]
MATPESSAAARPSPALVLVRLGADGVVRWVGPGAEALGVDLAVGAPLPLIDPEALGGPPLAGERLALRGPDGRPRALRAWTTPGNETVLALQPLDEGGLLAEAARLSAVVAALPLGVGVVDARGRTLSLNPEGLRLHGLASEGEMRTVLARPYDEVFELRAADGRRLAVDEWPFARALRGEPVVDIDIWLRRLPDGAARLVTYTAVTERGDDDAVRLVVFVIRDVTERRRQETRLRESEERYRALFEAIDEGFCVIEMLFDDAGVATDYRFLEANPAFERHTGLVGAVGRTVRELVPDLDASWFRIYGEVASTGVPRRFENHAPALSRWFDVYALPVGPREQRRVALLFTDVTRRKATERALRDVEERYRLLGRATNDVIWDWDLATDRLDWNEAVLQHFGCPREALGPTIESWTERIHPDERARVVGGIHAAIDGGQEAWSDEYRFRRSDGSYATFLDRGYIARDADGRAVRMIGSMLDLTGRRQAEAALRESEARFRRLADAMPQLVWVARPDGHHEYFNQRWYDYSGATPAESEGEGWARLLHPDDRARTLEAWRGCLASGEPYGIEYRFRRGADGAYRWFLGRAEPVRDEAGAVVRWFGTCTEVEELKRAQEALRDADRRKDEYLAMLAHELRNPLAPVRNAVELLRMVGPRAPAQERATEVIDRQVTHMARLIDDLLDVSRIARGRIQLQRQRCDLAQVVRQTAEDYRANLEASGLTLVVRAPAAPLWVQGDRTRLAQMVGNLLHNAGKFTPRGGRVTVSAAGQRDDVLVTVEDTGIGLPPDLLPRIFDPFAQAEQGPDRSAGGLGLGLPLVKGLAELHGGGVTAESAGPGQGAAFTLRLPLAADEAAAASAALPAGEEAPGLRVVVIEDNRDAAESLRDLLTIVGHEVRVAFDGRDGLEAARALRPEVVICDLGLPGGLDGCAVARRLRAEPATASALLVALSGYGQDEDRRRTREAGFDAHLVKPVGWSELEAVLGRATPRRRTG